MFIGQIGKVICVSITIKGYIYRKNWGDKNQKLYLAVDENQNVITFRSTAKMEPGTKCHIEGKVKKHSLFNDQCQTHISKWSLGI